MAEQKTPRDIDLLFETGSLRHVPRAWQQVLGLPVANILEHTTRLMLIALVIARREGKGDELTILKTALLHDLAEARTLDSAFIHKEYIDRKSEKAEQDMFSATVFEKEIE